MENRFDHLTATLPEPDARTFTAADNQALTSVGLGTLLGGLFRQYWIPALPVSFLEGASGLSRRIRLLGEDLVLFRTTRGEIGTGRSLLFASARAVVFWSNRGGWHSLSLPRLEVCSARGMYRHAQCAS